MSFHLGLWFFDEYFSQEHVEDLHGEYAVWFIEDFYELLKYHELPSSDSLNGLVSLVKSIGEMYESNEEEYYDFIESRECNSKTGII